MGCAHASKILTNEDMEFIAKNTAMTKDQVEVTLNSWSELATGISEIEKLNLNP